MQKNVCMITRKKISKKKALKAIGKKKNKAIGKDQGKLRHFFLLKFLLLTRLIVVIISQYI